MPRNIKKSNLPTKVCSVCKRPFAWRKKWEKNWNEIKYCSELRKVIEKEALYWAVAECTPEEIDGINILNASIHAMHRAVESLGVEPSFLAIDGNRFKPYRKVPFSTEVKGDGRFLNIAAASILAKTHRDEVMLALHEKFPQYGWDTNAGYPTIQHRVAIREFGVTPYHRKTFRLLPKQMKLF